jgi:outer membrane protein
MNKYIFFTLFFFIIPPILWRGAGGEIFAQDKLTLDQALELALKNNYAISISRNDAQAEQNNFSYGNAGFLPVVSLNASGNYGNNNTNQHYSSGLDVNKSGVVSTGLNTGVALGWTLFDGMKMFATYDRLRELSDMGVLRSKMEIENTVSAVINAYFAVVKQKQLIRSTQQAITIYEERVKIAETKLNIGSGSKLDVLQAKADLNEQRSALLKQQSDLGTFKFDLAQLLAKTPGTDLDVSDSLVISFNPKLEELKASIGKKNSSILFAEKNVNVYDLSLREVRSQRYPRLGVNLNYNFTRSENQAGFILLNQNLGFNAGFTASWTIFNGWNTNRQIKNAELLTLNSRLQYDQTKTEVGTDLLKAWTRFQQTLELLKLEEDNYSIVEENVKVALESFRIGKTSSLELKTAQTSFENAQSRLVTARYDAKVAETELLRLSGGLVK